MPAVTIDLRGQDSTGAAFSSAMGKVNSFSDNARAKLKAAFEPLKSVEGLAKTAGLLYLGEKVAAFAEQSLEAAENIVHAAKRAGASVEDFSRLAYAARQSGADMGTLETAVFKLQKSLGTAVNDGLSPAAAALKDLGLKASDLIGLSLTDQFIKVTAALRAMDSTEEQAAASAALMGRGVNELRELMAMSPEQFKKYTDDADRLGITMKDSTAVGIEAAEHAMKQFWSTFEAGFARGAGALWMQIFGSKDAIEQTAFEIDKLEHSILGFQMILNNTVPGTALYAIALANIKKLNTELHETETALQRLKEADRASHAADALAPIVPKHGLTPEKSAQLARMNAEHNARIQSADAKDSIHQAEIAGQDYAWRMKLIQQSQEDINKSINQTIEQDMAEYLDQMANDMKEKLDTITEYSKAAAEHIQGALADFLFDPFHAGLRGMLASFVDTLRRMVAEALAADILNALFGKSSGGGGGLAGWLGTAFAVFGGGAGAGAGAGAANFPVEFGLAEGGPMRAGETRLVGERGPELFRAAGDGRVIPNGGQSGPPVVISPVYNISGLGLTAEQLAPVLARNNKEMAQTFTTAFQRSGMRVPVF